MKFWQKLYLFLTTIFIIIFTVASIGIVEKTHYDFLNIEVKGSLSEHASFLSGLNLSFPMFDTLRRYSQSVESDDEFLVRYIKNYYKKHIDDNAYIEIVNDQRRTLYSNAPFTVPASRPELKGLKENTRQYIVRDIGTHTYIFISNTFQLQEQSYTLTYMRDLTTIYTEKKSQYLFLFQILCGVIIIFAIITYIVSRFIMRPVTEMIEATKRISKGNFEEKIPLTTHDEFRLLAENFNRMSSMLQSYIFELERSNQAKEQFIRNFTHELKTPLTSIIGYAELLRSTKMDEGTKVQALNYIYSEGKRLEDLSTKLMMLLKQNQQFSFEEQSLLHIIEDVKGSFAPTLMKRNISLHIQGNDFSTYVEPDLIRVVLTNIIDNALKASSDGTDITVMLLSDVKCVAIVDQGSGIPEAALSRVFEPFFMVDEARTRTHNNAGLGLAICHEIMLLHGGTISIESTMDVGTTVSLCFAKGENAL